MLIYFFHLNLRQYRSLFLTDVISAAACFDLELLFSVAERVNQDTDSAGVCLRDRDIK